MNEFLRILDRGALVLDLGCGDGSFEPPGDGLVVVRVDLQRGSRTASTFVQADGSRLPFRTECFDLIISNHSLEHFEDLAGALNEIGRVVKPTGALYVAVPDATTFSDRLYRWLARGGGHVNPFSSARELGVRIEHVTGLRFLAARTLCTSLSCLNERNHPTRAPNRLLLLGGGKEISLLLLTYILRLLDRFLATRLSVYGWALYFANTDTRIECQTWTNVCIRCGNGHSSYWLRYDCNLVRTFLCISIYRCPSCGATNLFTEDKHYEHLAAVPSKEAGSPPSRS